MEQLYNDSATEHTTEPTVDAQKSDIVELIPWSRSGLDGDWFGRVVTSVILTFGTFGNMMTIVILSRLQSGWSAINMYLTALAVSDLGMLYSGVLGTWTRKVIHYDLYASHWTACKILVWVLNTTASLSAWLLVALTVQRALSVVWPHRVSLLCTRKLTQVVIGSITLIMLLLYSHVLYGLDLVNIGNNTAPSCTFNSIPYQDFWGTIWVRVDMFLYSVIPAGFLVISNGVLAWKLASSVKDARNKLTIGNSGEMDSRKKKVSSATTTVIVVSITYVFLTIPLMVYNSFFHVSASADVESRAFQYFLYECFFTAGFLNFAVNFYLYCLTGTKFRKEFVKIVRSCWKRPCNSVENSSSVSMGPLHSSRVANLGNAQTSTDDF